MRRRQLAKLNTSSRCPAMESLSRTWTSPELLARDHDGKLDWFDGPPSVTKGVALAPHQDSKTQVVLEDLQLRSLSCSARAHSEWYLQVASQGCQPKQQQSWAA